MHFTDWYIYKEKKSGIVGHRYSLAINSISRHYSEQIEKEIDLFEIDDIDFIKELKEKYGKNGQYHEIGNIGKGTYRFALSAYIRYLKYKKIFIDDKDTKEIYTNNIYEADIKNILSVHLKGFFPSYNELKINKIKKYKNETDLLLESSKENCIIIVKIIEGIANLNSLDKIGYYFNTLRKEVHNTRIKCLIIGNEIDEKLIDVCSKNNDNVMIMKYTFNVKLEKIIG